VRARSSQLRTTSWEKDWPLPIAERLTDQSRKGAEPLVSVSSVLWPADWPDVPFHQLQPITAASMLPACRWLTVRHRGRNSPFSCFGVILSPGLGCTSAHALALRRAGNRMLGSSARCFRAGEQGAGPRRTGQLSEMVSRPAAYPDAETNMGQTKLIPSRKGRNKCKAAAKGVRLSLSDDSVGCINGHRWTLEAIRGSNGHCWTSEALRGREEPHMRWAQNDWRSGPGSRASRPMTASLSTRITVMRQGLEW
jgi:hypothetical protein